MQTSENNFHEAITLDVSVFTWPEFSIEPLALIDSEFLPFPRPPLLPFPQPHQHANTENNYISERHYPIASSSSQFADTQSEWEDVVIIPPASHYGGSSGNLLNGLGQAGFSGGTTSDGMQRNSNGIIGGTVHHHKSGPVHGSSIPRHRTSYVITKLRFATNYEVRVQARNLHGWNKLSATFYFATQAYEGKKWMGVRCMRNVRCVMGWVAGGWGWGAKTTTAARCEHDLWSSRVLVGKSNWLTFIGWAPVLGLKCGYTVGLGQTS